MNKTENSPFWFQAGAAILGQDAMQAFSRAEIIVAASGPGSEDFLQCAVQSGVGALHIASEDAGQEAFFKNHLKNFLPGYTKVTFTHTLKSSRDLTGDIPFMAVCFNVSPGRELIFEKECTKRQISFISTVSAGCGFLLKYLPAGYPPPDTRRQCDRLLASMSSAKAPDWAARIAKSAAGFQTWNFIQTQFCTRDNQSPHYLLLDLWNTRWCMDSHLIARVLEQNCTPEKISWQPMQTKTP